MKLRMLGLPSALTLLAGLSVCSALAAQRTAPKMLTQVTSARPLTNAEVIRMVHDGLSESFIIHQIQSRPAHYDLSPQGTSSLRQAGVSQNILNAMYAAAGIRGQSPVPASGARPGGIGVANAARSAPPDSLMGVGLACSEDPTFRILRVTGIPDGVTLTPGPQYIIWGCSFGPAALSAGQHRYVYAMGQPGTNTGLTWPVGKAVYFLIQSWSESSISVTLPASAVSNLPDTPSLEVCVQPVQPVNNKIEACKPGFSFKAGPRPGVTRRKF